MDQVNAIIATARDAQPNTALADARISMSGFPVMLRDTRDYYNHDIRLVIIITIFVVLLILIALLRAIVAPLYLILSVIISYLSALGIGVLVFQFLFGQELHWSVPGLAFVILVAVGADYNMLLISRIRDESPHGMRFGVIRTVGFYWWRDHRRGSDLRRVDVRPVVCQHRQRGAGQFRRGHRPSAGHIPGTHHHGAGRRCADWPRELVAVAIGVAAGLHEDQHCLGWPTSKLLGMLAIAS